MTHRQRRGRLSSPELLATQLPGRNPGSAGGALVNAGLEAFVRTAAGELPCGLRLNIVSPVGE
jgi:hypothetical protein